jgi:diacylglycerol kinase
VLRNERNARFHLVVAVLVLGACAAFRVSVESFAAVVFAVMLVFVAEIVNSAIEKTLDIVEPNHNPAVGTVKDMAAAGVLVTAIGAAVVGLVVFVPEVF